VIPSWFFLSTLDYVVFKYRQGTEIFLFTKIPDRLRFHPSSHSMGTGVISQF